MSDNAEPLLADDDEARRVTERLQAEIAADAERRRREDPLLARAERDIERAWAEVAPPGAAGPAEELLLDRLDRLSMIDVDAPIGERPGIRQVKGAIRKGTYWYLRYMSDQLNALHNVQAWVLRRLDERLGIVEQAFRLDRAVDEMVATAAAPGGAVGAVAAERMAGADGPVLVTSCGDGASVVAMGTLASVHGVDEDPGPVLRGIDAGLDLRVGDPIDHLRALDPGELAGVVLGGTVLRRPVAGLVALLDEVLRATSSGATVIVAVEDLAARSPADAELLAGRGSGCRPGCVSSIMRGAPRRRSASTRRGGRSGRRPRAVTRAPIVHQFTAVLADLDAVGQHTLAVDDLLRDMGVETAVYAAHVHPEVRERGRDFRDHDRSPAPDLILYQTSTGSPVAEYLLRRTEPLVLNYHNMTPAAFFDPWEPAVAAELDHGRRQLARLCRRASAGVAVSEYNAVEIEALGVGPVEVVPVLFEALWSVGGGLSGSGGSVGVAGGWGGVTLLFVGRVAPNKCQQDLVAVLAVLRERFGVDARLVLVGGVSSVGYVEAVRGLAGRLGVEEFVVFAGSVSDAELAGWFSVADVFVSVSEHEGFGVPLVEAMGFGVPVVAFGAAAVGETVGCGGVVLGEKSPVGVAAAVWRVLSDGGVREGVGGAGSGAERGVGCGVSVPRMRAVLSSLLAEVS
ncbi:MAG: glycosyltransferase [Acidimicrobiales bacterium]